MARRILPPMLLAGLLAAAAGHFWNQSRQHARIRNRAVTALEQQRFDEAIALLRATLVRKPNDAQARYLLAQAQHQQGDLAAALEQLQQIPPNHRHAELVMVQIAGIQLAMNRPGAAEQVLRQCLRRFPGSIAARQYLLDLFRLQLRDRELLGGLDELWKLTARRPPADRLWVLAKTFTERFSTPDDEEIWPALQSYHRTEPDNVSTQVAMAKLRLRMNADVTAAAESLEQCLARDPQNLDAIAALCQHSVQNSGSNRDRVEQLLQRWQSLAADAQYWETLGDWQSRHGHIADAMASYEHARAGNPADRRVPFKLGLLMIRAARAAEPEDTALSQQGDQLIGEANRLKEARAEASPFVDYLAQWLGDAAGQPPEFGRARVAKLVQIAAICRAARLDGDALRWCELIQQVSPGEPKSLAMRSALLERPGE